MIIKKLLLFGLSLFILHFASYSQRRGDIRVAALSEVSFLIQEHLPLMVYQQNILFIKALV